MSLIHRYLQVSFSIGGNGASEASNLSFKDLRMSATITAAGSATRHLSLKIFGMTLDHMNALSYIPWNPNTVGPNTILVQAGDQENGMSTVFEGTITIAWPNMQNAPEVSFDVEAMTGTYNGVKPANPPYLSFSGQTDVKIIHQKIASLYDPPLIPESNGVNMKLDSPYFSGSPANMMHQLGKMTKLHWIEEAGKLAMWPDGQSRAGGSMLISPQTGMVGYPAAVPGAIVVKKLFDRTIPYGSQVTIKSDIKRACGDWTCLYVNLELDNYLMPHNRWFATLFCYPLGTAAAPPPQ